MPQQPKERKKVKISDKMQSIQRFRQTKKRVCCPAWENTSILKMAVETDIHIGTLKRNRHVKKYQKDNNIKIHN